MGHQTFRLRSSELPSSRHLRVRRRGTATSGQYNALRYDLSISSTYGPAVEA
jgi:hypothetical protein